MHIDLGADHRVSTAFSSGTASVAEMITAAEAAGLHRLVVADAADSRTTWIPAYLAAVARATPRTAVSVHVGLTVRVVDTTGRLDLPQSLSGVEYLVLSTESLVLPAARRRAGDIVGTPSGGPPLRVDPADILVAAVCRGLAQATVWGQPILADPFAPLRRLGLSETALRPDLLHTLAHACRQAGAAVEINEQRRSPSLTAAVALAAVGVPLLAASGARTQAELGPGEYVRSVAEATTPHDYAAI